MNQLSRSPQSRYENPIDNSTSFSPTKHHLAKIAKKETAAASPYAEEPKNAQKSILYNQPNLFLDDARLFLDGIETQMKQFKGKPLTFKPEDEERKEVHQGLLDKNDYVKTKMLELMETTRIVLQKIKTQEKNEFV